MRWLSMGRRVLQRTSISSFGEYEAPVIGRQMLLKNKRASGRPQDQADVARLTEGEGDV